MQPRSDASWKPASRTPRLYFLRHSAPRIARRRSLNPLLDRFLIRRCWTRKESRFYHPEHGRGDRSGAPRCCCCGFARRREACPFPSAAAPSNFIEHAREVSRRIASCLPERDDFRRLFQQAPGFCAISLGNRSRLHLRQRWLFETGRAARQSSACRCAKLCRRSKGRFWNCSTRVHTQAGELGCHRARPCCSSGDLGLALEQRYVDFPYAPISRYVEGKVTASSCRMDRTEATMARNARRCCWAKLKPPGQEHASHGAVHRLPDLVRGRATCRARGGTSKGAHGAVTAAQSAVGANSGRMPASHASRKHLVGLNRAATSPMATHPLSQRRRSRCRWCCTNWLPMLPSMVH